MTIITIRPKSGPAHRDSIEWNRRLGPCWLAWVVVGLALVSAGVDVAADTSDGLDGLDKRPNFLFILADDQSPHDLRAYDPASPLETPNLDQIAARGMVIDGAYHMGAFVGAVCTPSRHMIMSGRTVWHLPIGPRAKSCPPQLELNTIPAVFNRGGYATMRTCKKGNSYEGANKQFTVRRDASKLGDTDETGSAWHAQQVLDYLDERDAAKESKPFFIYLGFSHPHDPRNGKAELLAKYGAVNHSDKNSLPPLAANTPALPANYLPSHPFPHGHPDLRDEVAVSGVWENRDETTIRNERGRYDACSENIDTQIGRVLRKLEAMGELENTYVIYTADHGIAIGRHGLQGKQNLYEHTWRVPLMVMGKGIKAGSRAPGNVYLLDLLATVCDLANLTVPETNEGLSFRPVLEGRQPTVRDVMYGVYCGGTKPGMRSVRQGDWKLIQYDVLDGKTRETQLFNLKDNPHEFLIEHHDTAVVALTGAQPHSHQRNLADDPGHANKLKEMKDLLLSEMRKHDDPYRLWDQPRELRAYRGTSPTVDGILAPGEWSDAVPFEGVEGWTAEFTPTTRAEDLSLTGWVKYDATDLYFAFRVTDDVLYAIDTPRWLPDENPRAHELTREGWPWFGDEMELLINAANRWHGDEDAAGTGAAWQMVCNLTKSRLGGVGTGGLLEGEPRAREEAWNTYQRWIQTGAMRAAARVVPGGKGYVIEWAVRFDPCLETAPGVFFSPGDQEVIMGLNIAVGDLDEKETGAGNFGHFHHEDWFSGEKGKRTHLNQWGTLRLMPGVRL